jgi:lactoylglutathione lyase
MNVKIATVAVYVENQKEALRFWTEKVGMAVVRSHPIGLDLHWVELRADGPGSCLALFPRSMMPDWAERKPSVVFECENLEHAFEVLNSRGVIFTQPPQQMPWGPFAIFSDNEGNLFGLRQKK